MSRCLRWRLAVLALAVAAGACGRPLAPPETAAEVTPPRIVPPPRPAATAAPAAPEATSPPPAPPAPGESPAPTHGPTRPILLRVGLASDLAEIDVPCCAEPLFAEGGGRRWILDGPIRVTAAPGASRRGSFRVQVAALKDEGQAASLARRLGEQTGQEADAHFDAAVGLYRVRLGRWAERRDAESQLARLAGRGMADGWVVSEGGELKDPALAVWEVGEKHLLPGRWLALEPQQADGSVRFGGRRYRGRLLVFLNERGALNVVNELPLEEYLRGVVPAEMGPERYPRLEALKAQAVAARTYTLRNLGEFNREGYDICATPRCQVYGGIDVEHPLADQAIAETARQVLLFHGEPIDARYSATCGGHTEDVAVVFPLEDAPYLKGVPCIESGPVHIGGAAPTGRPFPAGVVVPGLPPVAGDDPRAELAERLEQLAMVAGLPLPDDHLASLARGEVRRFVTSLFDLALPGDLLAKPAKLASLVADPPADWSAEEARRAALFEASGLFAGSDEAVVDAAGAAAAVFALARLLGVVDELTGDFQGADEGRIQVRTESGDRDLPLSTELATFQRREGAPVSGPIAPVPGDRVHLYLHGDEVLAIVEESFGGTAGVDPEHRVSAWTRTLTDRELATRIDRRYPGLGFRKLEILSRGSSGRVGKLRLFGSDGESVDVEGLAIRWTLELPDTRFTATHFDDGKGRSGWRFHGSGWGHGVGMCQVGSYAMAGRGASYRDILLHYYFGVELARVRSDGRRWWSEGAPPVRTASTAGETGSGP